MTPVPVNANYAAVVVKINALVDLPGLDRVKGAPLQGYQAIVDLNTQVGDVGIVFTAETQLSLEYTSKNNLHRHGDLNENPDEKGYLEDSRRVKAIKFRGQRSDCLFMPMSSLEYTGIDLKYPPAIGTVFDRINEHEICNKFERPTKGKGAQQQKFDRGFVRVDPKHMPEHFDTSNYFREGSKIPDLAYVYITQKLHGTSIRVARAKVARELKWREKVARKLGVQVQEHEYDAVYGSRKVIKDAENPNQAHFYGEDIWTREGRKIKDVIPEGFVIYGELIGWVGPGQAIQSRYTYDKLDGCCTLYVYRIAYVNPQGRLTDLAWPQVKQAALEWGLNPVPELGYGLHQDFMEMGIEKLWLDKRFADEGYPGAVPLGRDTKLVDEGVCIRWDDGLAPVILKAKSPEFLRHESKMLDDEKSTDVEASEESS